MDTHTHIHVLYVYTQRNVETCISIYTHSCIGIDINIDIGMEIRHGH